MAKKNLSRVHEVVLKVTFDRPCSAAHALAQVKDNIHGEFYPTQFEDKDPGLFVVKGAKSLKTAIKAAASKA